jgi:hypothetical protein
MNRKIAPGEFVYICRRNEVLCRAKYISAVWLEHRSTGDGPDKGPGWVWSVEEMEEAPIGIPKQKVYRAFNYLKGNELW